MKTFLKELLYEVWQDAKRYWVLIPIFILFFGAYAWLFSVFNPPPKPKYWTISYTNGVYTTDTISYTPVGCVTFPRHVLCGDFIVTEKEGKLPDEQF
jgi:hypothetical protein